MVHLAVELLPAAVGAGPEGSRAAAGADVGDEEEAGDGRGGGGRVDVVDASVAINLVRFFRATFASGACESLSVPMSPKSLVPFSSVKTRDQDLRRGDIPGKHYLPALQAT